jgi:hypothetical protein
VKHAKHAAPWHPHVVPILHNEDIPGATDTPDAIEPDVRYRMVSEAVYHRYLDRGCADGFDSDDWLAAEGDVERGLRGAGKLIES